MNNFERKEKMLQIMRENLELGEKAREFAHFLDPSFPLDGDWTAAAEVIAANGHPDSARQIRRSIENGIGAVQHLMREMRSPEQN